jgi:hypothetical protein
MKHFALFTVLVIASFVMTSCADEVAAPVVITRPKAPTNAVATALSSTAIRLTWEDNADNEEGFVIARGSGKYGWMEIIRTKEPNVVIYLDTFEAAPPLSSTRGVSYLVWAYNRVGDSQMAISNEEKY